MIQVPMNQNFEIPWELFQTSNFNPNLLRLDGETVKSLEVFKALRKGMHAMAGVFDDR